MTVPTKLEIRVIKLASLALEHDQYVSPIGVLCGLQWLAASNVDKWRQGQVPFLEDVIVVGPDKTAQAVTILRSWALDEGLVASEVAYIERSLDRHFLRFTKNGNPETESAYRTHWVSPELSKPKRNQLIEKQNKAPDLVVVSSGSGWSCATCHAESGTSGMLMMKNDGPNCLRCVGLNHLVFLPAGDASLTRRAKKNSKLSAVVVRYSQSRRRYERQGLLIEERALDHARNN